jgi:hypothetical protein
MAGDKGRGRGRGDVGGWLRRWLRAGPVKGSQHCVRVGDIVESERQASTSGKRFHPGVGVMLGRQVAECRAAARTGGSAKHDAGMPAVAGPSHCHRLAPQRHVREGPRVCDHRALAGDAIRGPQRSATTPTPVELNASARESK